MIVYVWRRSFIVWRHWQKTVKMRNTNCSRREFVHTVAVAGDATLFVRVLLCHVMPRMFGCFGFSPQWDFDAQHDVVRFTAPRLCRSAGLKQKGWMKLRLDCELDSCHRTCIVNYCKFAAQCTAPGISDAVAKLSHLSHLSLCVEGFSSSSSSKSRFNPELALLQARKKGNMNRNDIAVYSALRI